MDAYGLSDYTGELRADICDYDDENFGLTWEIFTKQSYLPQIYKSVIHSGKWQGRNTSIFYKKALKRFGTDEIECKLKDGTQHRELLKTYKIKLMGIRLKGKREAIGVLKIELPSSFDDVKYYDDEDEKDFFSKCAEILQKEIMKYKNFIDGNWFDKANGKNAAEFSRMINQINRVSLISKEESSDFWDKVEIYVDKYKREIQDANDFIYADKPENEKSDIIEKIWIKTPGWMKEVIFSETVKKLFEQI
jgi:hypothetical protein